MTVIYWFLQLTDNFILFVTSLKNRELPMSQNLTYFYYIQARKNIMGNINNIGMFLKIFIIELQLLGYLHQIIIIYFNYLIITILSGWLNSFSPIKLYIEKNSNNTGHQKNGMLCDVCFSTNFGSLIPNLIFIFWG